MNRQHLLQFSKLIITLVLFTSTSCQTNNVEEPTLENQTIPQLSAVSPADRLKNLIPKPVSVAPGSGLFQLTKETKIYYSPQDEGAKQIGEFLASQFGPSTGFTLQVVPSTESKTVDGILLTLDFADPALGDEGYTLIITPGKIIVKAQKSAGLFWAMQTLRQLLPPGIESKTFQSGPWEFPAATIRDTPRFSWRGVMVDVSRHFFSVEDVKRIIDLIASYKMNRLHMHISDDQGWRLMINSWPNLAEYGGSTKVGGGSGGYYTQADFAEIVGYAQKRYITIIPEIDMPGHTNAALASYPELNCNGKAPNLYTGTEVGFSSLCIQKEVTFTFLAEVIQEIAAITPGAFIHIGGDEAAATPPDDYKTLMERVQKIVQANGKQAIGWEEISQVDLLPTTIAQYWSSGKAVQAVAQGNKVIMSPAPKIYLDMKYNPSTPYGLTWAGTIEVSDSYNWDPAAQLPGIQESNILGVEAPLWSETLETIQDIEYMFFPRLLSVAEIGWSLKEGRGWDEYKIRLGKHGARMDALQIHYFPSPEITWFK
jgi:hexosaminidase